ncbi:MAG: hypothetical protein C4586_08255 [Anaerolineaceae bacterium]|nr:MAG: hypothetical protein C4586_08255 [Anaerolineaceae bacterium]
MAKREWMETLIVGQADGTAYGASVTPTSIIPAAAVITLPANYFEIGKKLRIKVGGRISNIVTTPGTLTLDVRLGAVIAFTTQAIQLNATAKTNVSFLAEFELTCRAIGSGTSANLMGMGCITSESVSAAATGAVTVVAPASAPAVGTGFDSTAAQALNVFGTWSINDAGNTLTVHTYEVVALN